MQTCQKKNQNIFACKLSELSILAELGHFIAAEDLFQKLKYSDAIWRVQILHTVLASRIY